MENRIKIKNVFLQRYPFMVAFIMIGLYLFPKETMTFASSDAAEIWKTIMTYETEDVYGTYVLYKGLSAVYPYLWFYKLSLLLGLNEWFFVKIYHCVLFSYVTTIGFPKMIELLTKQKVKTYRKLILMILCFYFWEYTYALSNLMIDLPSMCYFVLLVNCGLKIYRGSPTIWNYIWYGVLLGINLCASGQYTMPGYCVTVLVITVTVKRFRTMKKKCFGNLVGHFFSMSIFAMLLKGMNNYYLNTFVAGLREKGAWIPDAAAWLSCALTRFMTTYRTGGALKIPSSRNAAILQDALGIEEFEQKFDVILGGGYPISISEYLELFFKYPVDFILCYFEKFFIMLSPDKGSFRFVPLFIFYSLIFVALYIGFTNCKKIKDILNVKFWIGFAFIWAIVPALVGTTEPRVCMQIQGLIISLAVCSDFIWEKIKTYLGKISSIIRNRECKKIMELEVPYAVIL